MPIGRGRRRGDVAVRVGSCATVAADSRALAGSFRGCGTVAGTRDGPLSGYLPAMKSLFRYRARRRYRARTLDAKSSHKPPRSKGPPGADLLLLNPSRPPLFVRVIAVFK